MHLAILVVTLALASLLTYAAARKLSRQEEVVAAYRRVGVKEEWLTPLAVILLLAAAGVVVGLFWRPVGLLASGALVIYFVGALLAHVQARDTGNIAVPLVLELLSLALLVMRMVVR